MLRMLSRSDTETTHVVIFALDTLERDASNAATALTTYFFDTSSSVKFLSMSSLLNIQRNGPFSLGASHLVAFDKLSYFGAKVWVGVNIDDKTVRI